MSPPSRVATSLDASSSPPSRRSVRESRIPRCAAPPAEADGPTHPDGTLWKTLALTRGAARFPRPNARRSPRRGQLAKQALRRGIAGIERDQALGVRACGLEIAAVP